MTSRITARAWHCRRWLHACILALGTVLAACSDGESVNAPDSASCPPPGGEFSQSACAYVRGVALASTGAPLERIAIQVDSINPEGNGYASSIAAVGVNGRFELTVFRIPPLRNSPNTNTHGIDTVTVVFKAYPFQNTGLPSEVVGRATAKVEFARLGAEVKPSTVELRFGFP